MSQSRTPKGKAIKSVRRTRAAVEKLRRFAKGAKTRNDLGEWRRAQAILTYIEGVPVISIAKQSGVTRGSVNRWLQWYNADSLNGLRTARRPGRLPRLSAQQRTELGALVEIGPAACGFDSGIWTGPMIGELIRRRYGVTYHQHHIPRLLHKLGFSVQRPRKRLARADAQRQEIWLRKRLPAIKKKPVSVAA